MNIFKKITTHNHARVRTYKNEYYFMYIINKFLNKYIIYKIFDYDKLVKLAEYKSKMNQIKHPELYDGRSFLKKKIKDILKRLKKNKKLETKELESMLKNIALVVDCLEYIKKHNK